MSRVDQHKGNLYYDKLNIVGESKAEFVLMIGIVFGLLFIIIGLYMAIYDDSDLYLRVKGSVVEPTCAKSNVTYDDKGYPINTYKCSIIVAYKIDGNVYSRKMFILGSNNFERNEPIDLMILKQDYTNIKAATTDGTTLGCIFVCMAFFSVGLAYLNYYLVYRYKTYYSSQ
jgi:hypothetical protein